MTHRTRAPGAENDLQVNSASSLNPDAGNYPITDDPRELEAARLAGVRCLEEIPYVDRRYGERGRKYTHSDGAWLATLAACEKSAMKQVFWLGRVLAGRGMPRYVLERHLELMVEELTRAVPDKDYSKLSEAAAELKRERLEHVPRFDELAAGHPDGVLLVAAVADEKAGVERSVESLLEWFTDPSALALVEQARSA